MKENLTRQPESQLGVDSRKEFVKPELRREAKLPTITSAFVGTYNP